MAKFLERHLYGGAVVVDLPNDYIDSSTLRQVPDHQEVFLSPTTLTSIIFEINEYVANQPNDTAAAHYHINDIVQPPDHLILDNDSNPAMPPQPEVKLVQLPQASVHDFPTSMLEAIVQSHETVKHQPGSNLPAEWQTPQTKETITKILQLVVRMPKYSTDFCVRINIPMKELLSPEAEANELGLARLLLEKIFQSLDVKEFELFG